MSGKQPTNDRSNIESESLATVAAEHAVTHAAVHEIAGSGASTALAFATFSPQSNDSEVQADNAAIRESMEAQRNESSSSSNNNTDSGPSL